MEKELKPSKAWDIVTSFLINVMRIKAATVNYVLYEYETAQGTPALVDMAAFLMYASENMQDKLEQVYETVKHDLDERKDTTMLPRTSGYLKKIQNEKK